MSHAGLAFKIDDGELRRAANDNERGPGNTEADRWRWLIERLKAIDMPAAVLAARFKLEGMSLDEYVHHMRRAMKTCGWPQAEELGD